MIFRFHHPIFFFSYTSTSVIYTLSLHDALPIYWIDILIRDSMDLNGYVIERSPLTAHTLDRKSTRLNSSHLVISYAVFCLKKKRNKNPIYTRLWKRYMT